MRKIETIHEIELSSRCNLACSYCPSPTLKRAKMDMAWETYLRSLDVVKHFVSRSTNELQSGSTLTQEFDNEQSLQVRKPAQEWATELPGLPQRLYEELAKVASTDLGATQKGQLQELRRRVLEARETPEAAMREVWGDRLANAPSRLRQALGRSLVVPKSSLRGTQGELALTGVGEALLHPRFIEAVYLAREAVGDGLLTFSTNGILFTDEMAAALVDAKPAVYISLHRPEVASKAVEVAKRHGLLAGVNSSFATSALNWVGEVDWHVSHPPIVCEYLRSGWAVIRADGTVGTCCWDAESESGYLGNVHDEPEWFTAPHEACKSCSLISQ